MVTVYALSLLSFIIILVLWLYREKQFHQERMELLKLFKAQSLNEFKAADQPIPPSKNFMKKFIDEAYQRKKEGESDV